MHLYCYPGPIHLLLVPIRPSFKIIHFFFRQRRSSILSLTFHMKVVGIYILMAYCFRIWGCFVLFEKMLSSWWVQFSVYYLKFKTTTNSQIYINTYTSMMMGNLLWKSYSTNKKKSAIRMLKAYTLFGSLMWKTYNVETEPFLLVYIFLYKQSLWIHHDMDTFSLII